MVACDLRFGLGSDPSFPPQGSHAKEGDKLESGGGMLGASLSPSESRKVPSDMPALKPYWGKPTVRNFREGDGNVGIIRSPVRAIALAGDRFCSRISSGELQNDPEADCDPETQTS